MPVTILLCGFVLYLGRVIFPTFRVALYAMYLLAAGGIVLAVWNRKNEAFRKNYFSNGFWTFLVIYVLFLVLDYKYQVGGADEVSHWGKMVKEMMRLDSFYCVEKSTLLAHKDYPPFTGLLEMLWCNLTGGHSDAAMLMGLHVAEYSFLALPLAEQFLDDGKKWKKIGSSCALVFFLSLLFFVFDASTFNTIYTDLYIAILFGFCFLIAADERIRGEGFGYFAILLGQCALVLSKQMGIAFVLLTWLFYTLLEVFELGGKSKKEVTVAANQNRGVTSRRLRENGRMRLLLRSVGLLLAPAVVYLSWKLVLRANDVTGGQFAAGDISLRALPAALLGRGSSVQTSVVRNYLNALFYGNLYNGPLTLTYIALALVALLVLGILFYDLRSVAKKGEIVAYAATLICGSVGYAFTMLVLYLFCFSEEEATTLASYNRYMGTYLLAALLVLVIFAAIMLRRMEKLCWNPKGAFVVLLVALLLTDTARLSNFVPKAVYRNGGQDYLLMAQEITSNTEEGAEIVLASSSNNALTYYVNYFLDCGRMIDGDYIYENITEWEASDTEKWDEFIASVREDGYLYVAETSDALEEVLGEYLCDASLSSKMLYRAYEKDGELRLERVE